MTQLTLLQLPLFHERDSKVSRGNVSKAHVKIRKARPKNTWRMTAQATVCICVRIIVWYVRRWFVTQITCQGLTTDWAYDIDRDNFTAVRNVLFRYILSSIYPLQCFWESFMQLNNTLWMGTCARVTGAEAGWDEEERLQMTIMQTDSLSWKILDVRNCCCLMLQFHWTSIRFSHDNCYMISSMILMKL